MLYNWAERAFSDSFHCCTYRMRGLSRCAIIPFDEELSYLSPSTKRELSNASDLFAASLPKILPCDAAYIQSLVEISDDVEPKILASLERYKMVHSASRISGNLALVYAFAVKVQIHP